MTPGEFIAKALIEVRTGVDQACESGVRTGGIGVDAAKNLGNVTHVNKSGTLTKVTLEIRVFPVGDELIIDNGE